MVMEEENITISRTCHGAEPAIRKVGHDEKVWVHFLRNEQLKDLDEGKLRYRPS